MLRSPSELLRRYGFVRELLFGDGKEQVRGNSNIICIKAIWNFQALSMFFRMKLCVSYYSWLVDEMKTQKEWPCVWLVPLSFVVWIVARVDPRRAFCPRLQVRDCGMSRKIDGVIVLGQNAKI